VEHGLSDLMEESDMTSMIDSPMLVGIAALITSVAAVITTILRSRNRAEARRRSCGVLKPGKRKGNRSSQA
jgi:hypothetical protein